MQLMLIAAEFTYQIKCQFIWGCKGRGPWRNNNNSFILKKKKKKEKSPTVYKDYKIHFSARKEQRHTSG